MAKFETDINRLDKLLRQSNKLLDDLTRRVQEHLGEDWYVTHDRGDGILLGSPEANNYRIGTYYQTLNMPRDEAIAYIEARAFN